MSNPLWLLPLLLGIYIFTVLVCEWLGISSQPYVVALLDPIPRFIHSIDSYAVLSPNRDKAVFELSLAWLFSLAIPAFFLQSANWSEINQRAQRAGGFLGAGIVLLSLGGFLLALLLYPMTPGETRYGRAIAYFFEIDAAYIWGAGIMVLAGIVLSSFVVGFIHLYKSFARQRNSK